MAVQLGAYAPPSHTLLHLSDTHLLAGGALLGHGVDTEANLAALLARVRLVGPSVDAVIFTGDLTDLGEAAAYRRLREMVEPIGAELEAEVIWVAGNHDEREMMRVELFGQAPGADPVMSTHDLGGLRIIALDTTVPGWHHGDLDGAQLRWLADELANPAPLGTILAMHHPPLPSHVPMFDILELQNQPALAEVIDGTDVRAIIAGHLHYSTSGTFAGVPVSVASASCYAMDIARPPQRVNGMDAGQAFELVHVWRDTITHSVVPVSAADPAETFTPQWYEQMAALSPQERRERFSRKR